MADNLAVDIIVNSSKARADLKLFNAEIAKTSAALKEAVKAGDPAAVSAQHQALQGLYQDQARTTAVIKANTAATRESTQANRAHTASLRESALEFGHLAHAAGVPIEGLKALRAGFVALVGVEVFRGFTALIQQLDEVSKRLKDIRDLSRETGAKPQTVQGMQELAKESGESADTANKFLTGLSATLTKVATQTRDVQTGLLAGGKAATDAQRNFATFGDKVVQVNRGGVAVTRDFSDSLAILQVNTDRLIKLPYEQQMRVLSEAFLRVEQNAKRLGLTETQLNAISKDVFQVPAATADILAKAYLNIGAKQADLAKQSRGFTENAVQNIDEEAAAREKLSQTWQNTISSVAASTGKARIDNIKSMTDFLTAGKIVLEKFPEIIKKAFTPPRNTLVDPTFQPFEPLKDEAAQLPGFMTPLVQNLTDIWNRFWKGLSISANAAELDVKTAATGMGTALKGVDAVLSDVTVSAAAPGKLPYVGRGPGRGDYAGYGPPPGGAGSGHGIPGQAFGESAGDPGSRLQSDAPGTSSYQAEPSKAVYPIAESAARGWESAAQSAADLAAATRAAADAAAKVTSAWVDSSVNTFAAGGPIRGPGSGTSDSILARLSNGEFVMNANSTRRLGTSFLNSLNSFAEGGLVGVPPIRFASGGLVAAATSSGTPVHLHLGDGHSFALGGPVDVVDALVKEAHSQQIRSAGTKPSWFASRPSGR